MKSEHPYRSTPGTEEILPEPESNKSQRSRWHSSLAGCVIAIAITVFSPIQVEASTIPEFRQRWIRIEANFILDGEADRVNDLLDRAAAVGYNTVYLNDGKINNWWLQSWRDTWLFNVAAVQQRADQLGMRVIAGLFPWGFCQPLLQHNPNLVSGYPIVDSPLIATEGELVPESVTQIPNGGFEQFEGDRLDGWFQDDPGLGSFVDTETFVEGVASIRFEDVGDINEFGHGRLIQDFPVEPFRQYRLRIRVKTEDLTARDLAVRVRDQSGDLRLGDQFGSTDRGDGGRSYFRNVENFTLDWTELSLTFNSQEQNTAKILFGVWGGESGKIWWDDLRIDAVPTLNVIRRDNLPLSITDEVGTSLIEGIDFDRVEDPLLGQIPFAGSFETYHEAPTISIPPTSSIAEGDRVFLSGSHALVTLAGQTSCSFFTPEIFEVVEQVFRESEQWIAPDGYMISHSEVRTGGWEPEQLDRSESSGDTLVLNLRRIGAIAGRTAPGRRFFAWSDMFDPLHNAVPDYYHVANTLEGSWEGLSPTVTILTWWGDPKIDAFGRPSLEFFAGRGHEQIIAGYYDFEIQGNYDKWMAAADGVPGVIGAMYTTWTRNFDDLELFAETWWGGAEGAEEIDRGFD